MKLRMCIGAALIAALAAPSAAVAQVDVGGPVFSSLELTLTQPKGFTAFTKAKTYEMSIDSRVTATDAPTLLSIADGDVTSGAERGHISVGAKQLASPLEAAVGKADFQSLDSPVEPLLTRWTDAMSRAQATVKLRQKVTARSTGTYRKLVLVTASTQTP